METEEKIDWRAITCQLHVADFIMTYPDTMWEEIPCIFDSQFKVSPELYMLLVLKYKTAS